MDFPCSQCGACCKNISSIKELREFDIGNGICKFLDLKTNLCSIYDSRPKICNIRFMYERYFYKIYDEKTFIMLNIKSCNDIQEKLNIDKKFRLKF